MGIIKSSFSFIAGTCCGIYIAQNYNVPNIKKLADTALFMAKHLEEKYRKPKKRDDDDLHLKVFFWYRTVVCKGCLNLAYLMRPKAKYLNLETKPNSQFLLILDRLAIVNICNSVKALFIGLLKERDIVREMQMDRIGV
ncbi:hypothetical protein TorRG33x02_162660 [Trema orientale]|uniref:Uncharacterized protein n=1 Tax=Trema orientale TaxID=63057 RepID=A0A2P5EQR7_TREOI|nr:hypothetical protein TorRG33x02_162660 [Trema orientale]